MGNVDIGGLDHQEQLVIAALAAGATHAEAGKLVNRSAKWVQRRLKDPNFAEALSNHRVQRVTQVLDRLDDGLDQAVDVVIKALRSKRISDQLRAAQLLMRTAVDLRGVARVESSISAMYAELAELRAEFDKREA